MEFTEAKALALKHFASSDPAEAASEINTKVLIEAIKALEAHLPVKRDDVGISVARLIFGTCTKVDRWCAPGPYIHDPDDDLLLAQLAKTLRNSFAGEINAPRFLLDVQKSKLFTILNWNPIVEDRLLDQIERELALIAAPPAAEVEKRSEFENIYMDCTSLIEAARTGNIRTRMVTSLPITPVIRSTVIKCTWRGAKLEIVFDPEFGPGQGWTAGPGVAVSPTLTSQWQHSRCSVSMTVRVLVDHALGGSALAAGAIESAVEEWPQVFIDLYEILDAVIWGLRRKDQPQGRWLLGPTDVGPLQHEVICGDRQVSWVWKHPPGPIQITSLGNAVEPSAPDELDLELSDQPRWHVRCRMLAEEHLSKGEANNALFWLNVAAEALLAERSSLICIAAGLPDLFEEMQSAKSYWESAREVLLAQFPEIAEQVDWPMGEGYVPSWFSRIKYLAKRVQLNASASEIRSQYARIHQHRNALFHGAVSGRLELAHATSALKALIWLEENFDSPTG